MVPRKFTDSALNVHSEYCRSSVILLAQVPCEFIEKQVVHVYFGIVQWVQSRFGIDVVRMRYIRYWYGAVR